MKTPLPFLKSKFPPCNPLLYLCYLPFDKHFQSIQFRTSFTHDICGNKKPGVSISAILRHICSLSVIKMIFVKYSIYVFPLYALATGDHKNQKIFGKQHNGNHQ